MSECAAHSDTKGHVGSESKLAELGKAPFSCSEHELGWDLLSS